MDDEKRKVLEMLGWTPELLDALAKTPEHEATDKMFIDRAERALSAMGHSALGFLAANPSLSTVQLAKKLNRGASPIGITMAVYREASRQGILRTIAKEMLIREILAKFSDGWTTKSDVHPLVTIGNWTSGVIDYSGSPKVAKYAERIVRSLTIDEPPEQGWKPEYPNDSRIDELFERFWPVEDPPPLANAPVVDST